MANVAPGSRNTDPRCKQLDEILGRFANISLMRDGPRENFKELLAPVARGTIQYSEDAVKTKYQGVVLLLVTVTADGRATNIRIVKGIGGGLDEMAVAAVRTWRFKPAVGLDNKPVAAKTPIEVTFRLY